MTRVWIVPPFADATLSWVDPGGHRVLDLNRAFAERVLQPDFIDQEAKALERGLTAPGVLGLLQMRAGQALLGSAEVHRHLRAASAVLAGISAPPSPVRLRLDDLELAHGTTQCSVDVLAASELPGSPYQPELDRALEGLANAEEVLVSLERDQQLAASCWLHRQLRGRVSVRFAGRFASRHADTLRRLGFEVSEQSLSPLVIGLPGRPAAPIAWRVAGAPPLDSRVWAGEVPIAEIDDAAGCRVAVVAFAALSDQLVATDGTSWDVTRFLRSAEGIRALGGRVIGEWWLGAPGVTAEQVSRTLDEILRRPVFDWVAGVRLFHWNVERPEATWGPTAVVFDAPQPGNDFTRYRSWSAEGSLTGDALAAEVSRVTAALGMHAPLAPARVAQAYAMPPPPSLIDQGRVCLNPDAALVNSPRSLDGTEKPTGYWVNLRSGGIVALDPRLVPLLQSLRAPVPRGEAFGQLASAQRERILQSFLAKSLVVAC